MLTKCMVQRSKSSVNNLVRQRCAEGFNFGVTSHHHDGSLTEPKHVATLDATLKSVVLDGDYYTIYCYIEHGTSF
jgi:hypothetical protein